MKDKVWMICMFVMSNKRLNGRQSGSYIPKIENGKF